MTTLYVGVDWHKRTSTWVAINEEREKVYEKVWECTPQAVQTALSSLPAKPEETKLAIEPVCGWRWMTDICEEVGIDVRIANTIKLRQIADSGQKTDKNDALTLAELLRADYLPEAYKVPDDIYELRMLVRERAYFISQSTGTKCRIHSVCTARGEHNTAGQPLHKAGRDTLYTKGSGLYEMFQSLEEINAHVTTLETQIAKTIIGTDTYKILLSIPGIGPVTAAAIYAEVGDFKRFKTSGSLISYAGIYPKERSSGDLKRYGSISKAGSKVLRYSIIEAAMRIRDTDASHNLYTHYDAAKKRNKTAKQARIVVAHKLLTIAWHLVHRGHKYDDHRVKPAQREITA
jgi:transposase